MSRLTTVLLVGLLAQCAIVRGQQAGSTAVLISDLKSANVQRRLNAYENIKADKNAIKRSDVRAALIDLLDRENRTLHRATRARGEGYAEYIGELVDTVAEITDWHDPQQVCILAESAYNPDSRLADELAVKGGLAVAPCLLKIAHGNEYGGQETGDVLTSFRQQVIPVMVHLEAVTTDLPPAVQQQIRQAIISGLRDSAVLVRQPTVQAVGRFGTQDMIPILQDIARSDSQSRPLENGQRRFDVREAATKAIQSIQERTKAH